MTGRILFAFVALAFAGCTKDDSKFETPLAIDQRAINLNASSDTTKMLVYSTGNWIVENRDNASWITLQKASGRGMDYAIASVPDNSAGLPRAATLIVKSGTSSDTVRLGQRGIVAKIAITAASVSSPANGGAVQTAIDTNIPLNIMNVNYSYTGGTNWISGLQLANKNLVFDVASNATTAARKAVIYMNYLDALGTNTSDSLVINQAKP